MRFKASGERRKLPVPEMGEPLDRLILDTQLDGWLVVSPPNAMEVYLPAYRPR